MIRPSVVSRPLCRHSSQACASSTKHAGIESNTLHAIFPTARLLSMKETLPSNRQASMGASHETGQTAPCTLVVLTELQSLDNCTGTTSGYRCRGPAYPERTAPGVCKLASYGCIRARRLSNDLPKLMFMTLLFEEDKPCDIRKKSDDHSNKGRPLAVRSVTPQGCLRRVW